MPLRDHFHPPLSRERHWESFHAAWCSTLADTLNRQLPSGFFAEELTHGGGRFEIDVAAFDGSANGVHQAADASATLPLASPSWSPPAPAFTLPAVLLKDFEVQVLSTIEGGPTLVAAIEMVSPANKDRPDTRRAFATKCASYLHQGISLIVVDIVTGRHSNLHNEIMAVIEASQPARLAEEVNLYAVAYRPVHHDERGEIQIWPHTLSVGAVLPVLALQIGPDLCLPVDLEATYEDVSRRRRLA